MLRTYGGLLVLWGWALLQPSTADSKPSQPLASAPAAAATTARSARSPSPSPKRRGGQPIAASRPSGGCGGLAPWAVLFTALYSFGFPILGLQDMGCVHCLLSEIAFTIYSRQMAQLAKPASSLASSLKANVQHHWRLNVGHYYGLVVQWPGVRRCLQISASMGRAIICTCRRHCCSSTSTCTIPTTIQTSKACLAAFSAVRAAVWHHIIRLTLAPALLLELKGCCFFCYCCSAFVSVFRWCCPGRSHELHVVLESCTWRPDEHPNSESAALAA
jgi:hypothetical protein